MALKHNHHKIIAFALGYLVAAFLPPQTLFGGLFGGLKSKTGV